jgi:hypothetical protein
MCLLLKKHSSLLQKICLITMEQKQAKFLCLRQFHLIFSVLSRWCHDTQPNDIQYNDTQHDKIQYNGRNCDIYVT